MINREFPESWIKLQLGEVVSYGKTNKVEPIEITDDTWVLELEDIEKNISKINKHVTFAERKSKSTKNKFEKGDVLYGKLRPYLNKIILAPDAGVCTTEIIPLSGGQHIDNRYIFYWLKHPEFSAYVTQVSYGVNMPRLGTKDGLAAPFVIAPLAEQKQIATKLDELLAQVDTIKTRLDAIPTILKRFRQSVLAAAVSGKMTEDWRESKNLEWCNVVLQDVANIIDPQPSHRTPKEVEGGIPYIGIGDLNKDGSIDFDRSRKVSPDVLGEHKVRYQLKEGDFVFGKIGTLGKATVLPMDREYTLSANVILIQPLETSILPQFLMYFLSSPETMDEVARQSNSTSQAAFGIKKMRAFKCKVPEVSEQVEIVRLVEELFSFTDQIEKQINSAQTRINNLTQSILAKAFRGELTAEWREQNPNLICDKNSAEVLLSRIKAERQSATLKKQTRKKRA